jgi:hypothetical protein
MDLPDGIVEVGKRDCQTCGMVAAVLRAIGEATELTVF